MAEQENKKTPSIRVMARNILKSRFFLIFIIVAFIIIIAGSSYILKLIRIKEDSSNSKNAPAAVRSYTNSANIDEDGNINFEKTPNEFWEELKERNNDITKYFSSAEELAKIINVTTVTQFLYTGEYDNPEEETAEEVNEKVKELATDINSKNTQGIVKLKRALEDGKVIYMTYKTPSEFRDLINTYNENPSDDNKNEALKYFTVEQNASASNVVQTINDENDESDEEEVTLDSLENVLFIGDSILGKLQTSLEGEGAKVLYQAGATANFFLGNEAMSQRYQNMGGNTNLAIGQRFDLFNYLNMLDYEPTAIYIILGQNNVSDSNRITGIEDIIEIIHQKYPDKQVYINSIVPAGPAFTWGSITQADYNLNQPSFNEELMNYCESKNNINFSDILEGYNAEAMTDDGLHPNPEGVRILFQNIKNNLSGINTNGNISTSTAITQSKYIAKVAKFYETTTSVSTNDTRVATNGSATYKMMEQEIDYQYYTNKYTLPFNYLYALRVISQDKDFVFELADLIYDSELEITVKDNITTTTTINVENYTDVEEYIFSPTLIQIQEEEGNVTGAPSHFEGIPSSFSSGEHSTSYNITKTTISTSDNLDVSLTLADSWWTKYEEKYEYTTKEGEVISFNSTTLDNIINENVTYYGQNIGGLKTVYENTYNVYVIDYNIKYKSKTINRSKTNTVTETGNKYTSDPAKVQEKTRREDEPNFVSIFAKNTKARTNIISARKWLYRALESNEDTVNLLDITKYLIYKEHEEIGNKDGFKKFDFETVWDEYENSFKVVSQSYSGYRGSGFTGNKGIIFQFFLDKDIPPTAIAAIMGNLNTESGYDPKAVQNQFNQEVREQVTNMINSGYMDLDNFISSDVYGCDGNGLNNKGFGYGIAQWTYWSRKTNFYNFAKQYAIDNNEEFDISNIYMQLDFMWEEIEEMHLVALLKSWTDANSVGNYGTIWDEKYEQGNDDGSRAQNSIAVYNEYLNGLLNTRLASNASHSEKVQFLFPNGIPQTESQLLPYLTTIQIQTLDGSKWVQIHKAIAQDVIEACDTAKKEGFIIKSIGGYRTFGSDTAGSIKSVGLMYSQHCYGLAVDINPTENGQFINGNPTGNWFYNPGGNIYSILPQSALVNKFKSLGWGWGGEWTSSKDYMHFSYMGY